MDFQSFTQTAPDVYASLGGVSKAVTASGMDKALTELVKLRVSQINRCAFCLQFHLNIARKVEIDPRKLDLLAGWRDAAFAEARSVFDEKELAYLAATIASINAWNRIAVGLHFPPPPAEANRSQA